MVSEWAVCRLADVCDSIDYGYTASAKQEPCGPKFLRITDIVSGNIDWDSVPYCSIEESQHRKFLLHHGDIVVARTGATTGYSAYITDPPDAVFASYLVRLRIGPKADARFIAYFLRSEGFWDYVRGVLGDKSAQPNASAKTLTQATLSLPPVEEQRAIAHILGSLDDKIELNRRMSRTLEGIAQAIFKSWFIDFDPVKAKMDGREPYGLKPEIADLFPSRLVESELGPIPEGWQVVGLLDISNRISGGTPKTSILEYWDGDIEWVSASDVSNHNRSYVVRTARRITQLGLANSSATIVPKNTTVITARGTVGNICLLGRPMAINQTNYGIRAHQGVGDFFVYFTVASEIDTLLSLAYGTIFDTITTATLADIQVVLPQQALLQAFDDIVTPLMGRALLSCQENLILEEIRDTLLPKLISGEIRIPDAERFLEVNT
jgi:type I restriction enzyme S subunit